MEPEWGVCFRGGGDGRGWGVMMMVGMGVNFEEAGGEKNGYI